MALDACVAERSHMRQALRLELTICEPRARLSVSETEYHISVVLRQKFIRVKYCKVREYPFDYFESTVPYELQHTGCH